MAIDPIKKPAMRTKAVARIADVMRKAFQRRSRLGSHSRRDYRLESGACVLIKGAASN